jgi:hypothetical protein
MPGYRLPVLFWVLIGRHGPVLLRGKL